MRTLIALLGILVLNPVHSQVTDAAQLVRQAMDHWRGMTSHSNMTMTIHRPDWERSMTMISWSKGDKLSLVRVIEPRKDAGNGTLLNDNSMWTFTPRINRIIKIPSSMMSQSWMGSDFSNKDISKSTDIIDQYDHELLGTEERDGHLHYTIQSVPHEDAAVVWGKEILIVRDDFVLIEQQFWDQDGILVKSMKTLEIEEMGGRPVAKVMRMGKVDTLDEWTQLTANSIEFDLELADSLFTLSNLRNPRQ
ncbi:MAG: outer membrane lipoprotein-sorting protein [Xanthomonadales bacterium]|nr:outer membrane lipoprotein-sorting protein [Gammaproteobacteria bacterium]MBT8053276.1 outer membrane lipoprotein-sorting protein [Gammaproteobacteria bacterium]NND56029.1 outer membrane lipoprotein-sorting protein [Xanthomonadales bacterium]NNK50316.1 outer membrane lipoprotein-sorting protein [Xanthomonadales bacterium]